MEGMGLKLTPVVVRLFWLSRHVWAYGWHFLDSWLVQMILTKGIARLWLPIHPPHPLPTHPPPITCHW